MSAFHPDLAAARYLPKFSWGPRLVRLLSTAKPKPLDPGPDVRVDEVVLPGRDGAAEVGVRLFRPASSSGPIPLLLWIHGGGLIFGSPEQDDRTNVDFVRSLGIAVAAVRYRLAPAHPAPAAVEDAHAALAGLAARADELGIDATRIAIGGASAGGGIAAALAQLALDRGEVSPVFQLLVYPMLDDRTVLRRDIDTTNVRVWTPKSNRYGWSAYLGVEPGSAVVPPYASAARRAALGGLPSAWIGVGTLDLFFDEDLAYAERLADAGVDCSVVTVPGAFHGFDALFRNKRVTREFWQRQADALRGALLG
ncbi:alpha/beta hydrolase fold domain-containing protein [Herbiconiux sp. L3-i23]|uniref:alpha/beta hydrolase fold domain-containing protein n=1 Tax=Herbiconiux sp. L3-i23 TaxID=2905871 RepID=UPI00206C5B56|nr:alpha/beta hydrolase [Herbiconiux sp. L3-i23]BDI22338.1 esterase [Herbiconiux sp. L3-i23]